MKKEKDKASKDRVASLRKELADLSSEADVMRSQWQLEKDAIHHVSQLREQIESVRHEIEGAERRADLNKAAELKYGTLPQLEKQLADSESNAVDMGGARLLREEVTEEEIAGIVSRWTGIPVTRLVEGEREKLLRLDEILHERVIGQQEAVQLVADAVIRARAGIKDPRRPIGSFLFLGPTGVGKTELARTLAQALFDSEDSVVRIDMSEYMEKHTVSRLIGAPPGYVGYEEGGQLTEAVRRKPYAVVLFDEIEKAHPDVFNALLQLLDDGRLTDAQGRTVDFKNTVIIMTSNIGSHFLMTAGQDGDGEIGGSVTDQVMAELHGHFRPEFLNRIDDIVLFKPLSLDEIERIVELMLADLGKRLEDRRLQLHTTAAARGYIARQGYDPVFGARPLKRYIQHQVETRIGRALIAGDVGDGATITVDLEDGELRVHHQAPSDEDMTHKAA